MLKSRKLQAVFYRTTSGIARVLFAVDGEQMVLLHGFIKKTRATPGEDLELAERRWKTRQGQQQGGHDE